MQIWKRLRLFAMLLSVPLAVSGCATSGATPTSTPLKVVDLSKKKLRPFKTRTGDTCETQRDAAAENSVRDGVVYCAFCDCPDLYETTGEPKPQPDPKKEPTTS